ncbi:hypothetical protein [Kordiimonas aestuarii]|nr:hypothetical protein [Kordiimonas aestuarii]
MGMLSDGTLKRRAWLKADNASFDAALMSALQGRAAAPIDI